jgi:hypothetical protein
MESSGSEMSGTGPSQQVNGPVGSINAQVN